MRIIVCDPSREIQHTERLNYEYFGNERSFHQQPITWGSFITFPADCSDRPGARVLLVRLSGATELDC